MKNKKDQKCRLTYVSGVEGNSIYLNDFRIAGPKPWGGGKVLKEWIVDLKYFDEALSEFRVNMIK